jgi:very-short-patch-repair endonuclease/predicted nucleic acid-binding Zn ribbon protein
MNSQPQQGVTMIKQKKETKKRVVKQEPVKQEPAKEKAYKKITTKEPKEEVLKDDKPKYNGKSRNQIKSKINEFKLDISHFGLKNYRKYQPIQKECPVCQSTFQSLKGHPKESKTCSHKCANQFFAKPLLDEQKEKIRNGIQKYLLSVNKTIVTRKLKTGKSMQYLSELKIEKTCSLCSKLFFSKKRKQLFCSNKCSAISRKNDLEYREKLRQVQLKRIANGTHSGWKSRNNPSYAELFFMKVLTNNNIPYKFEEPCGKYFIDFAIESKRIALEIDGKQHLQEDRKKSDQIKDEYLKSQEYYVYRIPWKSINTKSGKEFIENEINKFLEFYNSF